MSADIIELFNEIDDPLRMLCIDAVYVGCCEFVKGHEKSGRKLIVTTLKAANMDADLVNVILEDIDYFLSALPAHREMDELR